MLRDFFHRKNAVENMKSRMFPFIFILLAFSFAGISEAGENGFVTTGISRGRALALGGAYFSIVDDFSSGLYNPGAFKLNASRDEKRLRIFINPEAFGAALYDYRKYNRDFIRDDKFTKDEGLVTALMLLKGAAFTTQYFDFGVNLNEELIPAGSAGFRNKQFFSIENLTKESFSAAFLNFKLSSSVSLGMSGTYFMSKEDGKTKFRNGYTFGVLLNPNPKLNVGIAYNQIPKECSEARFPVESIEGETVTSGISYYPDDRTVLSIDLRNLNKEDKLAAREIHTGVERRFGEKLALRAGYYQMKETGTNVYSFGIGILPSYEKISKFINSTRTDKVSYTFIMEEDGRDTQWHVFSLLLRF